MDVKIANASSLVKMSVIDTLLRSGPYQVFNQKYIEKEAMAVEVVALARASSSAVVLCILIGMSVEM